VIGAAPSPAVVAPSGECTALKVRKLARRVTQIYDDALAPHGLTVGQIGLLATLRRSQGIGVGALAERLSADASTISRLLKPLEAAGYLRLEADPADRRARLVRLTDAGFEKRGRAIPGWRAAQEQVRAALGDGRLAALRFLLDDAHSHL
jgi:DNA-binding MarR family transcriptional regulator